MADNIQASEDKFQINNQILNQDAVAASTSKPQGKQPLPKDALYLAVLYVVMFVKTQLEGSQLQEKVLQANSKAQSLEIQNENDLKIMTWKDYAKKYLLPERLAEWKKLESKKFFGQPILNNKAIQKMEDSILNNPSNKQLLELQQQNQKVEARRQGEQAEIMNTRLNAQLSETKLNTTASDSQNGFSEGAKFLNIIASLTRNIMSI